MKVLFAVNNEKISESIIKKYQENYKEIISAKNVYYFNAIIKELQRDKSYDRVVVSEDLEPFSNKNYDMIDKFLFDKLDSISDEASNSTEGEIPIILICTDRREKSDPMLLKLFSIGVFSALTGTDRTIDNVCTLINKPRAKKEAKLYYKIDSDEVDYKSESAEDVSESEIQNILIHYKKLGRNEDKYVESFYKIASQYTDAQLKLIAGFLPLNVKAVLEEKCPKYQELMIGSVKNQIKRNSNKIVAQDILLPKNGNNKLDIIGKTLEKNKLTNPVVIPSTVDTNNVKKLYKESIIPQDKKEDETSTPDVANEDSNKLLQDVPTPVKRGRGRPKLKKDVETPIQGEKRGRGRPRKVTVVEPPVENESKEKQEEDQPINLFDIEEQNNTNTNEDNMQTQNQGQIQNQNSYVQENDNNQVNNNDDFSVLPGLESDNFLNDKQEVNQQPINNNNQTEQYNNNPFNTNNNPFNNAQNTSIQNTQYTTQSPLANLLTSDKKIVSFVGTSKNGTSFLVNNLAAMLSNKGINTAILDLTKNKNAYYIYTQNDNNLRNQAQNCIEGLRRGETSGIQINKNLTVYTTPPNQNDEIEDYANILSTLAKNYSLVLMDCDFSTNYNYFAESQEIYLVQTYDILTIQPLTTFLRELADRNMLDQNKLRVVINKSLKVRQLTEKMIVGGISCYNDPTMSYMKQLFDPNTIIYTVVPFEDQTYSKYLEGLVKCEISLNGYSRGLLESLSKLGDIVYPLISNNSKYSKAKNYNNYKNSNNDQFNNIDNTLDKMRKLY